MNHSSSGPDSAPPRKTRLADESDQQARDARDYAEAILRTSTVPLLVLDDDLRVITANEAFYRRFEVEPSQTEGCMVYALGNGQWDIPELRRLLEEVLLHANSLNEYEITHDFRDIGRRTMLLNGRRMETNTSGPERIVLVIEDITERKRTEDVAEDALRESEERYRRLVDVSNQVLYRHNSDWSEMRQLTGGGFLANTNSPDPNWFDAYIHPDDQPHVWERIQEAIRTKGVFELEHRVVRKDGSLGWTLSRSIPILDKDGEIVEWFGAASDVTARREAEELVRQNAETFQGLIQNAPFGIYVIDADFRLAQASRIANRVFGIDPLIGCDLALALRAIWAEPFASEAIGKFRYTLSSGEPYVSTDTVAQRADRDAVEAYDWHIERIVMPDGRFGVVCYFYELTERHRLEEALRESEERLRLIIDSAKEYAIISLDGDGRIASWNNGAERLLGYSEEEAIGQSGSIFFTPEDRERGEIEREMRLAREEGRGENERWHIRKDGSRFWASGVMLPMGSGRNVAYLKIFRDGTQERLAEERQKLLINELNHRVKNTLATVQAIASQTLRRAGVEENVRENFELRLRGLAASHDVLTQERWEGASLVRIITSALKPFTVGKHRVQIDGPALNLGPKPALALGMVLHELATNATKYGALSNETGRIEISWKMSGGKDDSRLHFRWEEIGGPPVVPPTRKGFGSRLIERSLASDLGADVRMDYAVDGVVCAIDAPAAKLRGGTVLDDGSFIDAGDRRI